MSGRRKYHRDDKIADISESVTLYTGLQGGLKVNVTWVYINGKRAYAAPSVDLAIDWVVRQGFFPL